jgi:hypothetical protein
MTSAPSGERITVEKIMSLSTAEYARTLGQLLGPLPGEGAACVAVAIGSGEVRIAYEPLDAVRLGGLLELPRARVTLSFTGATASEREHFLQRFDVAFQRGGG